MKYLTTPGLIKKFVKKKIVLSSKEITYGAIFSASSAALIILLITFTPIAALPTVRIAFEGILVKLSGYLFGIVVGFISGNITEILISILRPTFLHWAYYLTIVLYGVLGGLIKVVKNQKKYALSFQIAILLLSCIVFSGAATYLIINDNGFVINFSNSTWKFGVAESLTFLYFTQVIIILILPILYLILAYFLPRYFYLFNQIAPIYFLSILTGYFVTIPITTLGDSASYGQPYRLLILVAIVQVPLNIIVNMFVIYFVWRILNIVITKSKSGTYNKNSSTVWKSFYFSDKLQKITKRYSILWKYRSLKMEKKIKLFEKYEKNKIFDPSLKLICITGTNGKSSTVKYLSRYLTSKKIRNAYFISPHALYMNERIAINELNISNDDIENYYYRVLPYIKLLGLNYFETTFFMASMYFRSKNLKYIIVEGGIGAKNDIIGSILNDVGIITNVCIDHLDYFANDVKAIAEDKKYVASIQSATDLYVSETRNKIIAIYQQYCNKNNINFVNFANDININNDVLIINNHPLPTSNLIDFQLKNIGLAILFIKSYLQASDSVENIYKLLLMCKIVGRNEVLKYNGKELFLDSGHNISAITLYLRQITENNKIDLICFSCSKNKEVKKMIDFVLSLNIKALFFQNSSYRSIDKNTTYIKENKITLHSLDSIISIINTKKYKKIVFNGSFYFYSDVIKLLKNIK